MLGTQIGFLERFRSGFRAVGSEMLASLFTLDSTRNVKLSSLSLKTS